MENPTIDKLNYLLNIKKEMKQALIERGSDVDDTTEFLDYATKITNLSAPTNTVNYVRLSNIKTKLSTKQEDVKYKSYFNASPFSSLGSCLYLILNGRHHILCGSSSTKSHYYFDNNTLAWVKLANLPTAHYFGAGVVYNNRIYAMGGISNGTSGGYNNTDIVNKWNGEWDYVTQSYINDTWSTDTTLGTARYRFGVYADETGIYYLGGVKTATTMYKGFVKMYDNGGAKLVSTSLASATRTGCDYSLYKSGNYLYSIGRVIYNSSGDAVYKNSYNCVERYDEVSNTWQDLTSTLTYDPTITEGLGTNFYRTSYPEKTEYLKDNIILKAYNNFNLYKYIPDINSIVLHKYNTSNSISGNSVFDYSGTMYTSFIEGNIEIDATTGKQLQYRNTYDIPYSVSSKTCACIYKGDIHIFGYEGGLDTHMHWYYNTYQHRWENIDNNLPDNYANGGAYEYDGKIFLVYHDKYITWDWDNGYSQAGTIDSNPTNALTFEKCSRLMGVVDENGTGKYMKKGLHVIYGLNHYVCHKENDVYVWKSDEPLPFTVSGGAMCVVNGDIKESKIISQIYLFGNNGKQVYYMWGVYNSDWALRSSTLPVGTIADNFAFSYNGCKYICNTKKLMRYSNSENDGLDTQKQDLAISNVGCLCLYSEKDKTLYMLKGTDTFYRFKIQDTVYAKVTNNNCYLNDKYVYKGETVEIEL